LGDRAIEGAVMRWLSYAWSVIVNCFYIFIVLFVFDRLGRDRNLIIIVSILGVIYVTVRSIGIGLASLSEETTTVVLKKMNRILTNQGDEAIHGDVEQLLDDEKRKTHRLVKSCIDGFFLFLISLLCLVMLFSNLLSK
jgi:hypothetical protein